MDPEGSFFRSQRMGAGMEAGRRWGHRAGSPPLRLPPTPTLGADLILENGVMVSDTQDLPYLEARDGNFRGDTDLSEKCISFSLCWALSKALEMQCEQHKASLLMKNRQETNILVRC